MRAWRSAPSLPRAHALRREAAAVFDNAELMARSRSWLVDHDYLLRRERRLVAAARRPQERTLFKAIVGLAGRDRETWLPRLLAPIAAGGMSCLEWLGSVAPGKGPTNLEAQIEKVGFLKELGADRLVLSDLPLAGLKHFARRMLSRKATALARIKDPHRTIRLPVCCACGGCSSPMRASPFSITRSRVSGAPHASASRRSRRAGGAVSIGSSAISRPWLTRKGSTPPVYDRGCGI